jgi:DNA-binding transcriptional LysR family regulator
MIVGNGNVVHNLRILDENLGETDRASTDWAQSFDDAVGQAMDARNTQALAAFTMRFPAEAIDMVLLDRAVNLVDERIGLAIRISYDLDPSLIVRKLTVFRSVVCAASSYGRQHGAPRRLEELGQRNCLTHAYRGKTHWHFDCEGGPVSVVVSGNISANESMSLLNATLSGAGVALMPTYLVGPIIRSGQLVALLPGDRPRELDIQAVYASRKHMTSALRALLDFLVEAFPCEPYSDR